MIFCWKMSFCLNLQVRLKKCLVNILCGLAAFDNAFLLCCFFMFTIQHHSEMWVQTILKTLSHACPYWKHRTLLDCWHQQYVWKNITFLQRGYIVQRAYLSIYIIHKRRNAVFPQSRPNRSTDFDESGTMWKPTWCSVLISPVHAWDVHCTPEISCRCFQALRFTMKIEWKGIELFFEKTSKLRESATCGSSDPGLSACTYIK